MQVIVFQRLCMLVNINKRVDFKRSNMKYSIPSDKSVTLPSLSETCFSQGKANYHWLNSDYPVIVMSTTRYARVMRVEVFVNVGHGMIAQNYRRIKQDSHIVQ